MVDGAEVAATWVEVVPTAVVAAGPVVVAAATVVLAYTAGALLGTTTLEVVTALTTVQGQLVMVKVVEAVAV